MPKYRLKVYYQTDATKEVTKHMQQIMDDWKQANRQLEACRVFEFETETPLSAGLKAKLKALKEDWMDEVVLEEVKE